MICQNASKIVLTQQVVYGFIQKMKQLILTLILLASSIYIQTVYLSVLSFKYKIRLIGNTTTEGMRMRF